ncbi:response regulator [Pseudooceanicola nanhaiensis]|jgi:CheY-like chemotaxis protein|uniref:Response regulator n=1 Tax=Pseudooceanicola nanhaiensis TaxID=375761 RepID=A0A917WJA9_9RHOB|nr:response regulator [Pseudooceanicola nanhaiensis]GGM09291.1 response regulator [Pseudooceanicola nanhaiensis]
MRRASRSQATLDIILVEDDDADAKAVHRALEKSQVAKPAARLTDGVEALAYLRGETGTPPSHYVLLVDLNMPRMNGLELLAEIRRDSRLHGAVAFLLTTSADFGDIAAAYEQNVAGYIVKENAGTGFADLVGTLDHYRRLVELPRIEVRH